MTTPQTPRKPRKPAVRNAAFDPSAIGAVTVSTEPVRRKSTASAGENPFVQHVQKLWDQWLQSGRKSADTLAVDVPTAQGKPVEFKLRQAARQVANGPAGLRVQTTDDPKVAKGLAKGKVRVSFTVGNPKNYGK